MSDALVAIDERMITDEREREGSRLRSKIRVELRTPERCPRLGDRRACVAAGFGDLVPNEVRNRSPPTAPAASLARQLLVVVHATWGDDIRSSLVELRHKG